MISHLVSGFSEFPSCLWKPILRERVSCGEIVTQEGQAGESRSLRKTRQGPLERQVAFIGGRSGIRENSVCSGALNGGWARKRLFMDRITPEGVFITAVPITKLTPKGS